MGIHPVRIVEELKQDDEMDSYHSMLREFVDEEMRHQYEWDEWHLCHFVRWTGFLWPEQELRRLALGVVAVLKPEAAI